MSAGVPCPMCKKHVPRKNPDFPFCSDRCRTLDLSHWADGSYAIEGDAITIPDDTPQES